MSMFKVGDEVAISGCSRYNDRPHAFSKVVKVNGFGHIFLENGYVFDKNCRGRKTKERDYSYYFIYSAIQGRAIEKRLDEIKVQADALNAIKQVIDSHRGYSGVYHSYEELKAKLAALVETL